MATKVSQKPPEEEFVNGVPKEKYEWLINVGKLAREFNKEHEIGMGTCQAHNFTMEAMLQKLGVDCRVVVMDDQHYLRHYFVAIHGESDDDEISADAYPEGGTFTKLTGNEVNVFKTKLPENIHYYGARELSEENNHPAERRSEYSTIIKQVRQGLEKHPPDLAELSENNSFRK
ncbi:MAG: hypothetical protein ABH851_08535 [Methanobacteriota archaeon]